MITNFYNLRMNTLTLNELASNLKEWGDFFTPALSTCVNNIEEYAHKIYKNADIIEAYDGDNKLIGLLCIYLNQSIGYITHFVVHPTVQKFGVGYSLLKYAEKIALQKNINEIRLECYKNNLKGKNFYIKNLFSVKDENTEKFLFQKNIKNFEL